MSRKYIHRRTSDRYITILKINKRYVRKRQKELNIKTVDLAIRIYGNIPSAPVSLSKLINNKSDRLNRFALSALCSHLQCSLNDLFSIKDSSYDDMEGVVIEIKKK